MEHKKPSGARIMAYTSIDDPELFFQVKTYTGNGSTQSITFDGTSDMQPNMNWTKVRSETGSHRLTDDIRGLNKPLFPNGNDAEGTEDNYASFDSDGFSLKNNSVNENNRTYVAWCWKETATAGFDIVSYTGNGTSGATVNHGLGVAPNWYMVKRRSTTGSWYMYHSANTSAPATDFLYLNETYATEDGVQAWNDTAPTSSVFSLGDNENVNNNTSTYIAYLWAQKKGFSKFGSYVGNGSVTDSDTAVDGTFVYTGFKPAWIIWKISSDAGGHWVMVDNKRSPFNKTTAGQSNGEAHVLANVANAEGNTEAHVDLLSNGFKFKSSSNNNFNYTGKTYVYMAFAESPFVNSKGIPTNAR
jgi:hypothetical protein